MENWTRKHEPRTIEELEGRENVAKEFLDVFAANKNSTVIVVGHSSIGKSTFVDLLLTKYLKYSIHKYDSITHRNDRLLDQIINVNCNNVLQRLNERGPIASKSTALVIDNLDTISLSSEKNVIDTIITTNVKKKLFPLVLIVNSNSPKIVDEIKHVDKVIRLNPLSSDVLCKIVKKICDEEHIVFQDSASSIQELVRFSQGDIRLLITILQDIYLCFPDQEIDKEVLDNFLKTNTKMKNMDRHLFDSFKTLLLNNGDIPTSLLVYNNDKVLLPLLLQENFYKDLYNRDLSLTERINITTAVCEYISQGDIIETYIYTDQNWYLQDMHCFISCTAPLNLLSNKVKYRTEEDLKYNFTFSSELNKTSLKNINRKNIGLLCGSSNISNSDIHYASYLFNELVKEEKYDIVRNIGFNYSLDPLKFIETVIKINKCNPSIISLGTRVKKLIGTSKNIIEPLERIC